MWSFRKLLLIGLFSLIGLSNALAQEETTTSTIVTSPTTGREVIVTTVPSPKEVIVTPEGYTNCFTVAAGWNNDLWVPAHKVCQYKQSTQGVAWVEGYWACNKYIGTTCSNWEWVPGRWVKTLEVY